MTHVQVELTIPDAVSDSLREALQAEVREQTVLALFRRGLVSAGLAARLLDRSYVDFLDFLRAHGVVYAPGGPAERDADTLRR